MKKLLLVLTFLFVLSSLISASAESGSSADGFNWEAYSLEDLLVIQEDLNNVVLEKQRQWAIENGNRVIDFDTEDFTLYTTQTKAITPSVTRVVDDAPETTRFLWSSSDDKIARVNTAGTVTGVGLGDAEITCTAADDEYIFKTVTVHVVLPVTAVTISEPKVTLLLSENPEEGEAILTAAVSPEDAFCHDVSWTSSNEAVAVIDENGKVSAVAPGTATITAFSEDPFSASYPKRATAAVTVLQAVSDIELDQPELVMNKNAYAVLKPSVFPENASQKTVTWESSDPSIVRVSNGQLTALATGEATITCTASDGSGVSAQSKVTVIQMVTGIQIPDAVGTMTLLMNQSKKLSPVITPQDATNPSVTWESSDESVVIADPSGSITAVGCGTASVTCSAADGSGKSIAVKIFVPSIGFDEKNVTVYDRSGTIIDVPFYGDPKAFEVKPTSSPNFAIVPSWDARAQVFHLHVIPSKAGMGTIYLKDNNNPQSNRSFNLTIDHSAAYDTTSFPRPQYNDAMRYPERYEGTNISIYGKVLQKLNNGDRVTLRVATSWSWDNVYYVTYSQSEIGIAVIEDDWITVYGESTGVYTYSAIFGNEITIPSMEAERIFIGNN